MKMIIIISFFQKSRDVMRGVSEAEFAKVILACMTINGTAACRSDTVNLTPVICATSLLLFQLRLEDMLEPSMKA
jgi:hypothetical protein